MGALSVLVVVMRIFACLVLGLMIAALSACASNDTGRSSLSPAQLSSRPDPDLKGTELTWGGEIISVKNETDRTVLEILAYPLNNAGETLTGRASTGRFLADREGYLEPREYKPGRGVTVKGPFLGYKDGEVDGAFYRYPALDARELILWPEKTTDYFPRPRVNVGVGIGSHGRSGVGIGVGF